MQANRKRSRQAGQQADIQTVGLTDGKVDTEAVGRDGGSQIHRRVDEPTRYESR